MRDREPPLRLRRPGYSESCSLGRPASGAFTLQPCRRGGVPRDRELSVAMGGEYIDRTVEALRSWRDSGPVATTLNAFPIELYMAP